MLDILLFKYYNENVKRVLLFWGVEYLYGESLWKIILKISERRRDSGRKT